MIYLPYKNTNGNVFTRAQAEARASIAEDEYQLVDVIRLWNPNLPPNEDIFLILYYPFIRIVLFRNQTLPEFDLVADGTYFGWENDPNVSGINFGRVGLLLGGTPGNMGDPSRMARPHL